MKALVLTFAAIISIPDANARPSLPPDVQRILDQRAAAIAKIDEAYLNELKRLKINYTKMGDLETANKLVELEKEVKRNLAKISIPSEARKFKDKFYFVFEEKCTWQIAREKCENLGGKLAIVPDEATQAFLTTLANGRFLWLGASADKTEGRWEWVDGSKMEYRNFAKGEPSGQGENCLLLKNSGYWNDYNNEGGNWNGFGFICEWTE